MKRTEAEELTSRMPSLALQIARILLCSALLASSGLDQRALASEASAASSTLELLREEELDTVKLEREVHFTTPKATDIVAVPDTYRIVASAPNQLKLIAVMGNRVLEVSALSSNHPERISTPVALYVRDDDKFPHVLLLLPDGNALEAIGSYDAIRSRGVTSSGLTSLQIQNALKKKLETTGH